VSAYVLLEDGARFDGDACGAAGPVAGEVVFNTSMSGYQESMTDPSYAGQLITFTYPHVGNYGVSENAMESDRVHARAAIMRSAVNREDAPGAERPWLDWLEDCGIPAITGVDTRALVRHIRDAGAMRGGVFPGDMDESEARRLVEAEPSMSGRDLAREVSPPEPVRIPGDGPHIVGIDTGIKLSIVRQFREHGCRVTLLPCTSSAEQVLAEDPDAVGFRRQDLGGRRFGRIDSDVAADLRQLPEDVALHTEVVHRHSSFRFRRAFVECVRLVDGDAMHEVEPAH